MSEAGFANQKECLMQACDQGDAAACRLAETYNCQAYPAEAEVCN